MSYKVIATSPFERKLKKLAKKYLSIKTDLLPVIEKLSENPFHGISLGKNCYKIRFSISASGKGKSSGGRLITYIRVNKEMVFLLDIYDKSHQETVSDKELTLLIELLSLDNTDV